MASLDSLVEVTVGAVYEVSNTLGCGFLEKVYERALVQELAMRGIQARSQVHFPISYKGKPVGTYVADLVIEHQLLVELKCVETFNGDRLAQLLNYLKASQIKLGLLFNLQHAKVEWRRIIL